VLSGAAFGGIALPPAGVSEGTPEDLDWRMRSGRVIGGVEMRVADGELRVERIDG